MLQLQLISHIPLQILLKTNFLLLPIFTTINLILEVVLLLVAVVMMAVVIITLVVLINLDARFFEKLVILPSNAFTVLI